MVSGPPTKSINNSGLGYIKRILIGGKPFLGPQRHFQFGTEFHLRALKRKKGVWKPINAKEKNQMTGMIRSIFSCKLFTSNLQGATIEVLHKKENVFGIHGMHGTLDLKNKKKGRKIIIDLKTTNAKTEEQFIKKAIAYDYPRQGVVYEELDDHRPDDETYFIGVSKENIGTKQKPVYPHFIMDLKNFPNETRRSETEAEFLLSFYKQFGLPKSKFKSDDLTKFTNPRSR